MTLMASSTDVQIRIWARAPDLTATSCAPRDDTWWMSPGGRLLEWDAWTGLSEATAC